MVSGARCEVLLVGRLSLLAACVADGLLIDPDECFFTPAGKVSLVAEEGEDLWLAERDRSL